MTLQNKWSGEFYLAIIGEILVAVDITRGLDHYLDRHPDILGDPELLDLALRIGFEPRTDPDSPIGRLETISSRRSDERDEYFERVQAYKDLRAQKYPEVIREYKKNQKRRSNLIDRLNKLMQEPSFIEDIIDFGQTLEPKPFVFSPALRSYVYNESTSMYILY